MQRDAETEFLQARRAAHVKCLGISVHAHASLCDCGRRATYCAICHRDDFEFPEDTLRFSARDRAWLCLDCLDAVNGTDQGE